MTIPDACGRIETNATNGGSRLVTIKEIAEKSGVSIGTVDRVLHERGRASEATRQRVLAVAAELGYAPNRAAQGLAARKKKLHLGFAIVDPAGHPFFYKVLAAAEAKAASLAEYGVRVSFVRICVEHAENGEPRVRLTVPEDLSLEALDGIALPGLNGAERDIALAPLTHLDIPTVYYNNPPGAPGGLAYVGCDYERAGEIAAGLCALCTGEKGRVVVCSEYAGDFEIAAYHGRRRGFEQRLRARYPNMRVTGSLVIQGDAEADLLAARRFLAAHPETDAAYVVNPGDYGICRALRAADPSGRIRIVTNDLTEDVEALMREGIVSATICQQPEAQGERPLELLFEYLAYGKAPENPCWYTDLSVHIAENAD